MRVSSQVLTYRQISIGSGLMRAINILGAVLLLGLMAQIRVPLLFTPVPIVCTQIAIVILASHLNKKDGIIAILTYILAGAAGLPMFSGMVGGLTALTGPTGGYIAGYLLAFVYLSNYLQNRKRKNILNIFSHIFLAQFLIYIPGLIHLSLWMNATQIFTIHNLLVIGFFPFIVGDAIKAFLAVGYLSILDRTDN